MEWPLLQRLIGNLHDLDYRGRLSLFKINEPLLDERLEEAVAMARQQLPRAFLSIQTNGDHLTRDRAERLVSAGLDAIGVSVYEGTALSRLTAEGLTLLPAVHVRQYINHCRWENRAGLLARKTGTMRRQRWKYRRHPCQRPFYNMFIDDRGNAVLCCSDLFDHVIMGNIAHQRLEDIWNGPRYRQVRDHMRRYGRKGLELCRQCSCRGRKCLPKFPLEDDDKTSDLSSVAAAVTWKTPPATVNPTVHSFDVFDTLLARRVGRPECVFYLLERRAIHEQILPASVRQFAQVRLTVERTLRHECRPREITLEQIYRRVGERLGLSLSQSQRLMQLELVMEDAVLTGLPQGQTQLERARQQGHRIVFVSDTPLPGEFIRNQLQRRGLLQRDEPCYISSEQGVTKSRGLFLRLLQNEKVAPSSVLHCGDHPIKDYEVPRRLGMAAHPPASWGLNRYEQILEQHETASGGLTCLMAGASRLSRLSTEVASPRERALADVAAGVIAPVLTAYVLWILHKAQERRLSRLYFVSRDGQVILEIAKSVARRLNLDVELRYLYGSRQAWNLAALRQLDDSQRAWILFPAQGLTVARVLQRLSLQPDEIASIPDVAGANAIHLDKPIKGSGRRIIENLLANPSLARRVCEKASARRQMLQRYLRQEGFCEKGAAAIVDLGWSGRLQNALGSVVEGLTDRRLRGFYFGLESIAGGDDLREAYFYDRRYKQGFSRAVPRLKALMEMFCAADHGQVVDYAESDSRIVPVMRHDHAAVVLQWGLPVVRRAIHNFLDQINWQGLAVDLKADLRPVAAELLRTFWLHPSRDEAIAWGAFPYEEEQAGGYFMPLARPLARTDVVTALTQGSTLYRGFWAASALAMSSPVIKLMFRAASQAGRVVRPLVAKYTAWRRLSAG